MRRIEGTVTIGVVMSDATNAELVDELTDLRREIIAAWYQSKARKQGDPNECGIERNDVVG